MWYESLFCCCSGLSCVWLHVTSRTAACQACLSFTNSWSLLKLESIESNQWWCRPAIWSSAAPFPLNLSAWDCFLLADPMGENSGPQSKISLVFFLWISFWATSVLPCLESPKSQLGKHWNVHVSIQETTWDRVNNSEKWMFSTPSAHRASNSPLISFLWI